MLKAAPQELAERVRKLLAQQRELEKELERVKAQALSRQFGPSKTEVQTINGVKVVSTRVTADNPGELRTMLDNLKGQLESGIIVLGAESKDGKAMLICGVTDDLIHRFHAGEMIKALSAKVGGKGGGRADMAQGGGPLAEKLAEALATVDEMVKGS
jgi:alanyl-tRNA synthetase